MRGPPSSSFSLFLLCVICTTISRISRFARKIWGYSGRSGPSGRSGLAAPSPKPQAPKPKAQSPKPYLVAALAALCHLWITSAPFFIPHSFQHSASHSFVITTEEGRTQGSPLRRGARVRAGPRACGFLLDFSTDVLENDERSMKTAARQRMLRIHHSSFIIRRRIHWSWLP